MSGFAPIRPRIGGPSSRHFEVVRHTPNRCLTQSQRARTRVRTTEIRLKIFTRRYSSRDKSAFILVGGEPSRVLRIVLATWTILAIAGQVRAASDPDDLVREGVERRRHGDDADALRLFEEAYDKGHSPRALAQMALAEQALGRWLAASEHIRQALGIERDPWIIKNRSILKESAARVAEHVGQIDILGGTPGAEVRLDGVARGILPLRQPLAATTGTVTIDILMRGRLPVRRTTSVRAGEVTRESFDALATSTTTVAASLVQGNDKKGSGTGAAVAARATEVRVVADVSSSAEDVAGAANPPGPFAPEEDADGEPSRPHASAARMPLVLATGGLSLAALAFAIIEHVSWSNKVDSFEKMDACSTDFVDRGGPGCAAIFNAGRRAKTFAFVGYGAAGALAVTSAVLFFALPDGQPDGRIACSMNPARPSVGCAIRF